MPSDRTNLPLSLLDAARVLARGGDLDAKLTALLDHARDLSGASSAALLFYDGEADRLVSMDGATVIDPGADEDTLGAVVRNRRSAFDEGTGRRELERLAPGTRRTYVPLVVEDDGVAAVEGVLVVGFADGAQPDELMLDALGALADMAAVAIRQARLKNALTEQAEYQERLAHTDALTGIANRRTFEQMLELEIARASRHSGPLTVAIFAVADLDRLEREHGGAARDDVLRQVASTLAGQVRLIDTVARVGEDQFGVIAPGEGGLVMARRVRDAVAAIPPDGGMAVAVRAGLAVHPDDGVTADDVLGAANRALQIAQTQAAGAIVLASGQMEPG